MFPKIYKETIDYYESKLALHGPTSKGVDWKDNVSQNLRFKILSEIGDLSDKLVHDVGCGCGHFLKYLRDQRISCKYTGTDISESMIQEAKSLFPGVCFEILNVLEEPPILSDFIVISGLFYVKNQILNAEWEEFVKSMLVKLFEFTRKGLAFNMMTSYVDFEEEHLFYYSPQKMLNFCIENLSPRVILRHDYPLWEYSVYVYK